MKAATWKAVFAAMSPSPVFEAVATFAEAMVDQRRRTPFKEPNNAVCVPARSGVCKGPKRGKTRACKEERSSGSSKVLKVGTFTCSSTGDRNHEILEINVDGGLAQV
jgi:hypothetical protein